MLRVISGFTLHGVQERAGGVQVEGVAEFVGLRRAGGFDASRLLPRVVPPEAALAERTEKVAQRAIAEEVECLVGHFKLHRRLLAARAAAPPLPALALRGEVRRHRDVALFAHPLDDFLDQFLELRTRVALIAVGGVAEQPLDRLFRQDAAVEQGVQDRVVQRLQRPLLFVRAVRIAESAREEQIRQLRHEVLHVEVLEHIAGVFGVAIFHGLVVVFLLPPVGSRTSSSAGSSRRDWRRGAASPLAA